MEKGLRLRPWLALLVLGSDMLIVWRCDDGSVGAVEVGEADDMVLLELVVTGKSFDDDD